jgi:urocanate hydratase
VHRVIADVGERAQTRTVERALGLLAEVCGQNAITLSECARRAQLPPSTALRLLRTLDAGGFVVRDAQGCFRAGPRIIQMGAAALGREALITLGEPALRRLVATTGETAYLSIAGPGESAIYVAMVEGIHPIRHTSWVGRAVPMAGIAVGVALTGRTPREGYVAERDASAPDITAIAAPVRLPGRIVGALSVVGPSYRIDDDAMAGYGMAVRAEALALAAQLGGPGTPTAATQAT